MNSVIEFELNQIRMVGTKDRPEWVAVDVCRVLGIDRPAHVLRYFAESEKGLVCLLDTSGEQRRNLATQGVGQFDHWKLPSIRSLEYTWLVCSQCNQKLRDYSFHDASEPKFKAYQSQLQHMRKILNPGYLLPGFDG